MEEEKHSPLEEALTLWDQSGEKPYQVLKDEGLYDFFMEVLSKSYIEVPTLYRGTRRHSEKKTGDIITYDEPSSWTVDREVALRFVEEEEVPVILRLISLEPIRAIENTFNSYGEKEYVVYPLKLKIVKTKYIENMIQFDLVIV